MATLSVKHFDVHNYVKKAKELGANEELAEFQARQIEQAYELAISTIEAKELATKSDIVSVELRLIKWIIGTGATTILAVAGLLKLIVH